ncbi:MAG: hypothetical protein IJ874_04475 [Ruminococcus sp.]|nr:hypothetical protein [Ruminococcus sp.]
MAYIIEDAFRRYVKRPVTVSVVGEEYVSGILMQIGDSWILLYDAQKKREFVVNTNKIIYMMCNAEPENN